MEVKQRKRHRSAGKFCLVARAFLPCGMALVISSGCEKFMGSAVSATVLSSRGNVEVARSRSAPFAATSLGPGAQILAGQELRTLSGAEVSLSLIPGIFVELAEETNLTVKQLRVAKRGDAMVSAMRARTAVVRLARGAVRVSLPNRGSGRCEVRIETENGTILGERGNLFSVQVDSSTVRVVCADGTARWEAEGGHWVERVPAGYFRERRPGDVGHVERMAGSENAATQREISSIIAAGGRLEDLETAARLVPAPWRQR